MAVQVKLTDNSVKVKAQLDGNIGAALTAMGTKAVKITLQYMKKSYGDPIRKTGDLMRDAGYEAQRGSTAPRRVYRRAVAQAMFPEMLLYDGDKNPPSNT